MSDQTSPDAGAVASEASNLGAEQANAAENPELDTQASTEESTGEAKTFTQAELNEIVKKEKARAEAKAERRVLKSLERLTPQQAQEQQPAAQQSRDSRPTRNQGEEEEVYLDRMLDWKQSQRELQDRNKSYQTKTEKLYAEAAKLPGFDRDDFDSMFAENRFAPEFSVALVDSDHAPRLMAYLSSNPEDAARIAALHPARQAAEIGRLETRFSSSPTSRAAPPINPIGAGRGGSSKSLEDMSLSEYEKARASGGAYARTHR